MSPESATFSKAAPADVVFTVGTTDAAVTMTALKIGSVAVNPTNYAYDDVNEVLTIKNAYLSGLSNGEKTFTLVMSNGSNHTVTVTVETGNTVEPDEAEFSKAAPADVVFTVTPNAETVTLTALKLGEAAVEAANYTYASGTLTITDDYLATLENGEHAFALEMSASNNLTVTVTVGD